MIRKQIHIRPYQQQILKKLAQFRRLSEAELIRQAIDRQAGGASEAFVADAEAWEEAHAFMLTLCKREVPQREVRELDAGYGQARDWRRDDLYAERIERHGRHSD